MEDSTKIAIAVAAAAAIIVILIRRPRDPEGSSVPIYPDTDPDKEPE